MLRFASLLSTYGPDAAAQNILADISRDSLFPEKAIYLAGKSGKNFPLAHVLCAIVLEKAGDMANALAYWDLALKDHPCKLDWLQPALRLAFGQEENLDLARVCAQKWQQILEAVFVETPAADLLAQMEKRGWRGNGSLGIHQNRLRGWLWLDKGGKISINIEPRIPGFAVSLRPKASPGEKVLYEINEPLPDAGQFTVTFSCRARGNPVICSPARLVSPRTKPALPARDITVVIPVYDDRKATLSCLGSIFASRKHNRTPFNILAVWDHGPDAALLQNLQKLADAKKIFLAATPANLGFLGCVNHALGLVPRGDVILLNSDTLVHGNWIDRLARAAKIPAAGTITALGSEAEHVSYPAYYDRAIVRDLRLTALVDSAAAKLDCEKSLCEIPVGVGFCMLLTRRALERIGFLDGRQVCRGYGEEVDYSLRAMAAGLKNFAAANVFVAHLGGRSFGGAKKALAAQNNLAINNKFPDYEEDYGKFLLEDPLASPREAIGRELLQAIEGLEVLHLFPWGWQFLDPWDEIDREEAGQVSEVAIFAQKIYGSIRLLLKARHQIPLGRIHFMLPRDAQSLRRLVRAWRPGKIIRHGCAPGLEEAAAILGLGHIAGNSFKNLPPMPAIAPGDIWLATPPHDLTSWKELCLLAKNNPGARFYCPALNRIWRNARRPPNLLDLPKMDNLQILHPAGLLLCDSLADSPLWREWLDGHCAISLPIYSTRRCENGI